MSSFKTWLGLIAWNYGRVFAFLFMVCAIVGVLLALSLIGPNGPVYISFLNPWVLWVKIIIIISCSIVVFSFFLGNQNARTTNWRIAFREGCALIAEDPEAVSAIGGSLNRVKQLKDPIELNERMDDYRKLKSTKEHLVSLRKQEEELPGNIMGAVEKIEVLEAKVFS